MSDVQSILDRLYRLILEPPDAQPATTRLSVAIDDAEVGLTLTVFDIPEDENLMRLGSIIEIGSEMMRVVAFDANTRNTTVIREFLGTTATAHAVDAQVKLSPPFPRQDAFFAVRDNIVMLYPDLWTVKTQVLAPSGIDVFPFPDQLGVEVVEANPDGVAAATLKMEARIVDNHPRVGGRALVTNGIGSTTNLWVRYRRRFGTAATEADLLTDLGVDDVWVTLVMVSAAADLMAGRDVPAANTEWVQATLQAENIRVGTRMSIAGGLAQYRDILMGRFRKEMRAEDSNTIQVHTNDVWAQV